MLFLNETFTVKHDDLLTICSSLEVKRDYAVDMARYAIKTKDYGLYLDKKYEFANLNRLLDLDMFKVFPSAKMMLEFPEYPAEAIDDFPFFTDAQTEATPVVFSDGEAVLDECDVPF